MSKGTIDDEILLSCYKSRNAPVFQKIMKQYIPNNSVGADVNYGSAGGMWKTLNNGIYDSELCPWHVHLSDKYKKTGISYPADVKFGICMSSLPYTDNTLDFLVMDPPYSSGTLRKPHQKKWNEGHDLSTRFGDDGNTDDVGFKGLFQHEAVLELYRSGLKEAVRVLKLYGMVIVKCMDEVNSGRQHFTHCEVNNIACAELGLVPVDLFVVMQETIPRMRHKVHEQLRARKNHSYFLIYQKGRRSGSKPVLLESSGLPKPTVFKPLKRKKKTDELGVAVPK